MIKTSYNKVNFITEGVTIWSYPAQASGLRKGGTIEGKRKADY